MLNGITYILSNNATVQGLVEAKEREGATGKYKVYPVVAPASEKAPYIVVTQTGGSKLGKGACGRSVEFSVISYAKSYDDVTDLDDAVIDCLEAVTAGTYNSVDMSAVSCGNLSADQYVHEKSLYAKVSSFSVMI